MGKCTQSSGIRSYLSRVASVMVEFAHPFVRCRVLVKIGKHSRFRQVVNLGVSINRQQELVGCYI